jgi:hypothetical protein
MSTPEAKVKKMVKDVLAEFSEPVQVVSAAGTDMVLEVATLKQYWPVPAGFGASDLDCIVCYYGVYITIETKAPGKHPTPRQELTIAQAKGARGLVFVIDGPQGCEELRRALTLIRFSNK